MGSTFLCNDAAACGGRMSLKILVRDSSEVWKSLEIEFAIMFTDPLIFWESSNTSLMIRVHPNHHDTVLWSSYLTG